MCRGSPGTPENLEEEQMRTRIIFGATAMAVTAALVAAGPTGAIKPGSGSSTGSALVFKVNPVQSSGDQSLTDMKDSADAVPSSEYAEVELRNLDGSGYLSGDYANVRTTTGNPAYSANNEFFYLRNQDEFEQVMGYFWVNQAQEYLQSLGFGSTLPAILDRPFDVRINQYGVDNSYFWDKHAFVRLGKGGVDDAEDAEVIVHEYGHAVHHDQVDGFGSSIDAGAIGESFGDYFAVTVGLAAAEQYGWPVEAEEACPMDWDSVSYTDAPHCIRRFDRNLTLATRHNTVHFDGQIWSQALWEIRQGYEDLGFTTADWDTTYIASQFGYAPDTSFQDAAEATYELALDRDGQAAADLVEARFAARGITF
jgi:zinc metalloprotease ZmpB